MSIDPTPLLTAADCSSDYDPNSLPVADALNFILKSMMASQPVQQIPTMQCLGFITAEDIRSSVQVPPHDNSAMDGYAVASSKLQPESKQTLQVVGKSMAGKPYEPVDQSQSAKDNKDDAASCIRIMTGAVMPEGYDSVIMQEHVEPVGAGEVEDNLKTKVRIDTANRAVRAGQNTRAAGEDIQIGDVIVAKGRKITPSDMGLIASVGIASVPVYQPLTVAYFSTGDELQQVGEALDTGNIYDSNRYTLRGMLMRFGARYFDMGVIPDQPAALEAAFEKAAKQADVIISTGGVSVGEADYTKDILDKVGTVNFWKIAMKPGRPLAYGNVHGKPFFGLPGNPVSVMVTFYQFVRPALQHISGENVPEPITLRAKTLETLRKRPGRVEYQRGILSSDPETGELQVTGTGDQGSGILTTMSRANCFVILGHDTTIVEAGEWVEVQRFDGLI